MDINVTIEVNVRVMWPSEINSLTFRPPRHPTPPPHFSNDPQPTFLVTNEFFEYLIYAHLLTEWLWKTNSLQRSSFYF